MAPFLEVSGLKAFYGQTQALHGVSFSLEKGGITTLLGANGAGKTTTLRAICNMVRTEGTVSFDGRPIIGIPRAAPTRAVPGRAAPARAAAGRGLPPAVANAIALVQRLFGRGSRPTESIVRLGISHVPEGRGTFTTLTV